MGELVGQGRCACRGPDKACVTFPPDSLTKLKRPGPLISQTGCCTSACHACVWLVPETPPSSSLAACASVALPQLHALVAPWGHAYVTHTEAGPSVASEVLQELRHLLRSHLLQMCWWAISTDQFTCLANHDHIRQVSRDFFCIKIMFVQ